MTEQKHQDLPSHLDNSCTVESVWSNYFGTLKSTEGLNSKLWLILALSTVTATSSLFSTQAAVNGAPYGSQGGQKRCCFWSQKWAAIAVPPPAPAVTTPPAEVTSRRVKGPLPFYSPFCKPDIQNQLHIQEKSESECAYPRRGSEKT